ncbi:MAG: hypothetical protein APF84_11435 [Gracilibacter sp. BRH_c7a]|nr:MAG: hypothetical protein APF84_11435 [Gracilibacter sp. BRH_c7a]
MKLKNTLFVLYANLITVIMLWVSLFNGSIYNISFIHWFLIVVFIISSVLIAVFAVKNVSNAFRLYKNEEYNSLRRNMKVLKLGSIPYFLINFVFYFLLFALFFVGSRGFFIFTPIPLLLLLNVFLTYIIVLFTSSYGIGFVAVARSEKRLNNTTCIIHVLFQLCFVLDVISTILLLVKYKVSKTNI